MYGIRKPSPLNQLVLSGWALPEPSQLLLVREPINQPPANHPTSDGYPETNCPGTNSDPAGSGLGTNCYSGLVIEWVFPLFTPGSLYFMIKKRHYFRPAHNATYLHLNRPGWDGLGTSQSAGSIYS